MSSAEVVQIVGGLIVTVVGGLALRLGWVKGKDNPGESKTAEVVGSVVDNRAVKALIEAVESNTDKIVESQEHANLQQRRHMDLLGELGTDIRKLTRAMIDLHESKEGA